MNDGVSMPRADARRNYERLIQAASAVFEVQGASAALESIAKQAGVGIGTLYRHFPTRKALLEAIYADKVSALVAGVPSLLRKMSPDKAILAWLEMIVDYSAQYAGFSGLIASAAKDNNSPITAVGSRLLAEAQKTNLVRSDVTIVDLLRLLNGIIADITPEDRERTDALAAIIVAGLKK